MEKEKKTTCIFLSQVQKAMQLGRETENERAEVLLSFPVQFFLTLPLKSKRKKSQANRVVAASEDSQLFVLLSYKI